MSLSDIPEKRLKHSDEDHGMESDSVQADDFGKVPAVTTDDLALLSKVGAFHVLSESGMTKTCVISGHIGCNGDSTSAGEDNALFILERTPIDSDDVRTLLSIAREKSGSLRCVNQFANDAYSSSFLYQPLSAGQAAPTGNGDANGSSCELDENAHADHSIKAKETKAGEKHKFNAIKLTRIFPAEPSHFAKYATADHRLVSETLDDYQAVTLPLGMRKFKADWIYNILEGRSEQDRIIHSDADEHNGYVVVPDMKCVLPDEVHSNPSSARNLYALAIARRRDLRTLRDLDGREASHMQLLERINGEGVECVARRFGVPRNALVAFVHYPPSFYHLHVHIVHIGNERLNTATVGRGMHMLDTVISNLKHFPTYYHSVTLPLCLKTNDELFKSLTSRSQALTNAEAAIDVIADAAVEAADAEAKATVAETVPDSAADAVVDAHANENANVDAVAVPEGNSEAEKAKEQTNVAEKTEQDGEAPDVATDAK